MILFKFSHAAISIQRSYGSILLEAKKQKKTKNTYIYPKILI